jgi:hypothetical protein
MVEQPGRGGAQGLAGLLIKATAAKIHIEKWPEAAPYFLLLSATPHQGKCDQFLRLMQLVDRVCLSQIKSGHTGDAVRRGLGEEFALPS